MNENIFMSESDEESLIDSEPVMLQEPSMNDLNDESFKSHERDLFPGLLDMDKSSEILECEENNIIVTQTRDKAYHCDTCDNSFKHQEQLFIHLKTHTKGKRYHCSKCNISFIERNEFELHLSAHTESKPYNCDKCDSSFAESKELKLHQVKHAGEKSYQCNECEKYFLELEELKLHMALHTSERTYKCDKCEMSFTEKEQIRLHLKEHTDEKTYKCTKCGSCFSNNSDLIEHHNIHTEGKQYYCSYCENDRYFKTKIRFLGHLWDTHRIKVEVEAKTWSCYLCDKLFISDLDYETHLSLHTQDDSSQNCASPVIRPSQVTVDARDTRSDKRAKRKLDTQTQIKSAKKLINLKNQGQQRNSGAKVQNRPLNSPVWNYFNRVVSAQDSKAYVGAKCKLCSHMLAFHGSTSSLLKHIRYKHPQQFLSINDVKEKNKQPEITKYVHNREQEKWERGSEPSNLYDHKVARFIIATNNTLSVVDSKEFRDILNPAYTPVCRKTFKENVIFPLANETKEAIGLKLGNETEFYAVCTDCWSSGSRDAYTHVSVHYIDQDFNLQRVHLGVLPNIGSHTATNLWNLMEGPKGILTMYGIANIPHTYVTDNASNAIAAFEGNGKNMWFGCMGHTINLTVKAGMAHHKVKRVAKSCKALVAYVNASNIARNHLKEFQEFLEFENNLTVVQEVDTRWNSMKSMFDRLLVIRQALNAALISEDREDLMSSMDFSDWRFVEELSVFLTPFEELTEVLSGEEYVTIIYASGTLRAIQKHLKPNEKDSEAMLEVKELMNKDFNLRYQTQELKNIITITKLLDPRSSIKKKSTAASELLLRQEAMRIDKIEINENEVVQCTEGQELCNLSSIIDISSSNHSSKPSTSKSTSYSSSVFDTSTPIRSNDKNKRKSSSTSENLYHNKHFKRNDSENNIGEELYQCQSCALEFLTEKDYDAHIVKHIEGKERNTKNRSAIMQELMESSDEEDGIQTFHSNLERKVMLEISQYKALICSYTDSEKDFNILSWWKSMNTQLPMLAKTARYYLCIPATSTTSERSFSIANDIITKKRNRLSPDTVEKLTFLKNNFKYIPEYITKK